MHSDYSESKEFWRPPKNPPHITSLADRAGIEQQLCDYILTHAEKGNPADVIAKIDSFCAKNWMMNLGPEKGHIVKEAMKKYPIRRVLEIGGYCGYSALVFAHELKEVEGAQVFTIEVNKFYASVARKIQEHAGLASMIHIHLSTVEQSEEFLKSEGPFDMIFVDHVKQLYLPDFKLLEKYGVVKSGTLVVGDNIITPGAPDFLAYMRKNPDYSSVLYHSYVEYCDIPDAVLASHRK